MTNFDGKVRAIFLALSLVSNRIENKLVILGDSKVTISALNGDFYEMKPDVIKCLKIISKAESKGKEIIF